MSNTNAVETVETVEVVDAPTLSVESVSVSVTPTQYKFSQVEENFESTYIREEMNNSEILDMISVYLRGQKILYTEAKTLCEQRLNFIMLPAIFNTAVCTIIGLVLQDYPFGATIVSCLNGVNAFLLALINYLKLDARAEAHRTSAYKFDKAQSSTVFAAGRTLFGVMDKKAVIEHIETIEKAVQEIKESNQFVLPERIRYLYPILYNTNVFADVKTVMNHEIVEMEILRTKLNLLKRLEHEHKDDPDHKEILDARLDYETQIKKCLELRKEYQLLDQRLNKEVETVQKRSYPRYRCNICEWLKN